MNLLTQLGGLNHAVVLAAVGAAALLLVLALRRRPPAAEPPRTQREAGPAGADQGEISRSMERLLVELEGLSRKIDGQIGSNLARLDDATKEADRRIAALRVLIAESRRLAGGVEGSPSGGGPARVDEPTLPSSGAGGEENRQIYELADSGMSALNIAQRQGRPVGEIELILDLRRAESGTSASREH